MKAYERFLKYAAYPTMSDESSETRPSTKKQLALAKALCEELINLGLTNARVDENGYVYASLDKNCDGEVNSIGFIAHLDTSPEAADENIKTQIWEYTGEPLLLNKDKGIYLAET